MAQPIKSRIVLETVAEWFDIGIKDIIGPYRQRTVVHARWVCCTLLRKHTRMSLPQIGEVIDKDHTSVLNACAQMERLLNGSAEWRADYAEIESAVLDKSFPETRL